MFEREIKFIYDFNLNKVNRLGPYFTFEQLSAIDIHPALLNYISAEIDFLIFEDRQALLKNSVFEYSGEKISNLFSLISEEVKKSKRFALEYVSKLILHGSSFTVNFLMRPKWTLSRFVFDEGDHKTTLEIKQILNCVYYYQYLKKILISYINSKKIISMNSSEFGELLDRVDKLGIETYLPSILSNATKSMSDFFNIGEIQKNKIPFLAIEKFLEEKKLEKHLSKIHSVFGDDNTQKINIFDLQKTLDSIMIEKYESVPMKEVVEEEIKEEIQPVAETKFETEEEISANETYSEEELLISDEEKVIKPTKLRIRIDKDNEIEPVDETDLSNEPDEMINESENELEPEDQLETEDIPPQNLDYEEEQIQDEEIQDEETQAEHVDEKMEINEPELVEEEIEENRDDEPLVDPLHPDVVYDQIIKEEQDHEESMLQTILKNSEVESEEKGEDIQKDLFEENSKQKMDIAELLEHKDMTRIIEVIFDYDIEEFANTLDEISGCVSLEDALVVLNQSLMNRNISRNSKEAEAFKSIISQYFNR
jgi:hypothetical protein